MYVRIAEEMHQSALKLCFAPSVTPLFRVSELRRRKSRVDRENHEEERMDTRSCDPPTHFLVHSTHSVYLIIRTELMTAVLTASVHDLQTKQY